MDVPMIDEQVRRDVGSAADTTDFGSVQWAVHERHPAGAEQTIGLAVFDAGKSNVEHTHPNCEEVVYVLEGEVEHTLGDQTDDPARGRPDRRAAGRAAPADQRERRGVHDAHRLLGAGPGVRADRALIGRYSFGCTSGWTSRTGATLERTTAPSSSRRRVREAARAARGHGDDIDAILASRGR